MDPMLLFGSAIVAAGIGTAVIGVGRAVATVHAGDGAVDAILSDEAAAEFERPFVARLFGPAFEAFEHASRRVMPGFWVDRLRRNAALAGLGRWGLEGVLALKAAFAITAAAVLPMFVWALGASFGGAIAWMLLGAMIGFFVPDVWIARRADARQRDIRRALPETLDLLAIAVGAGMGLEGAMDLVSQRLPGPLGEEFSRVLREIQLGATRKEALRNLRERTEVSELGTFALSLVQADALGAPISEVLKVQAGEMRMLRRQRARESAAKVPVKLLFPMMLGIFPALGIVVIGPAVVSIAKAFSL